MNKKDLSETDIRTKLITPALIAAGWDLNAQLREEVALTAGRVIVKGKAHRRGSIRFADHVLSWKPNLPLAIIEAKDNSHSVGAGMQQALHNADRHGGLPFAFSSNGDAFLFHDRTAPGGAREQVIPLDAFPSPQTLWRKYCDWKGLTPAAEQIVAQDYYFDPSGPGAGKTPRYYQLTAINATVEAIARGQRRILLVMATGTGKTYTAFQIIWRLWKSGAAKRILFLVDRNILADQAKTNGRRATPNWTTSSTPRAPIRSSPPPRS